MEGGLQIMKKVISIIAASIAIICVIAIGLLNFKPFLGMVEKANPIMMDRICLNILQYEDDNAYIAKLINHIQGNTLDLNGIDDYSAAINGIDLDTLTKFIQTLPEKQQKFLLKYDQDGSLRHIEERFNGVETLVFTKWDEVPLPSLQRNLPNLKKFEVDELNKNLFTTNEGTHLYHTSKDNENPENPEVIKFLAITKNVDTIIFDDDASDILSTTIVPEKEQNLTIEVSENHPLFTTDESKKLLLTKDGETVLFCCGHDETIVVPEGVKYIKDYAFIENANITLVLPEGIESVHKWNTVQVANEILNPDGSQWEGEFVE